MTELCFLHSGSPFARKEYSKKVDKEDVTHFCENHEELVSGGSSDGGQDDRDDLDDDNGGSDKGIIDDNPKDKYCDDDNDDNGFDYHIGNNSNNCNQVEDKDHDTNQIDDDDHSHNHNYNQVDNDYHLYNEVNNHNCSEIGDDDHNNHNQINVDENNQNHNRVDDDNDHNQNKVEDKDYNHDDNDHNHNQVDDDNYNYNQVDDDNHNYNQVDDDNHNHNQVDDDLHNHNRVEDNDYNHNQVDDDLHNHNQVEDNDYNHNQVNDDDHNHNQVDNDNDHNRNQVDNHNHDDNDYNHNQVDNDNDHNHNQVDNDDCNNNQVDDGDHNCNQVDNNDCNSNQVDDDDHNHNQVDNNDYNHNQVDNDNNHNHNQVDNHNHNDNDYNHNQVNDDDHNHNQVDNDDCNNNQVNDDDHNHNQVDNNDYNHNQVDDDDHNHNQVEDNDYNHNQVDDHNLYDNDYNCNQVDNDDCNNNQVDNNDYNHNQVDNNDYNHNQVDDHNLDENDYNRNHHHDNIQDDGHNPDVDVRDNDHDQGHHDGDGIPIHIDGDNYNHNGDDHTNNYNYHGDNRYEENDANEGDLNHDDGNPIKRIRFSVQAFPLLSILIPIVCCILLLNAGCYCQVLNGNSDVLENAQCHCQVSISDPFMSIVSMLADSRPATFEATTSLTDYTQYSDDKPSVNYSDSMPAANCNSDTRFANFSDRTLLANYSNGTPLLANYSNGTLSKNVTQALLKVDGNTSTNQSKVCINTDTQNNVKALSDAYQHVQGQLRLNYNNLISRTITNDYIVQHTFNQRDSEYLHKWKRTILGYYNHAVILKTSILRHHQVSYDVCQMHVSLSLAAYQPVKIRALQPYNMGSNISCLKILSGIPSDYSTKDSDYNVFSLIVRTPSTDNDTVTAISQGTFVYSNASKCSKGCGMQSSDAVKAIATDLLEASTMINYWKVESDSADVFKCHDCSCAAAIAIIPICWNVNYLNFDILKHLVMPSRIQNSAELQHSVSMTTEVSTDSWNNNSNACIENVITTWGNVNTSVITSQSILNMRASVQLTSQSHPKPIHYVKEECTWLDAQHNATVIYSRLESLQNLVETVSITEVTLQDYHTIFIISYNCKPAQYSSTRNYSGLRNMMTSNIASSNTLWSEIPNKNLIEITIPGLPSSNGLIIPTDHYPDVIFGYCKINITNRVQVAISYVIINLNIYSNDPTITSADLNILWCTRINGSIFNSISQEMLPICETNSFHTYCDKCSTCNNTTQLQNGQFSDSVSIYKWNIVNQKTKYSEETTFTGQERQRESSLFPTSYCVSSKSEGDNSSSILDWSTLSVECYILQKIQLINTTATNIILPSLAMSDSSVLYYQEQDSNMITEFNSNSWTETAIEDTNLLCYKFQDSVVISDSIVKNYIIENYDVNNSMLQSYHHCYYDSLQYFVITRSISNCNTSLLDNMTTSSAAILQCGLCTSSSLQPQDQFQQNITPIILRYDDKVGMFFNYCRSLPICMQVASDHSHTKNFVISVDEIELTRHCGNAQMLPGNSHAIYSQYCSVVIKEKKNAQGSLHLHLMINYTLALTHWSSLNEVTFDCMHSVSCSSAIMINCVATSDYYPWTLLKLQLRMNIYSTYCNKFKLVTCYNTKQSSIQLHNVQFGCSSSIHRWSVNTMYQKTTISAVIPFTGQKEQRELLFLTNCSVIISKSEGHNSRVFNFPTQIIECIFLQHNFTFLNITVSLTILPSYVNLSHHLDSSVYYQEQDCSGTANFNSNSWIEIMTEDMHYWRDLLCYKFQESAFFSDLIVKTYVPLLKESYDLNQSNNSMVQSHCNLYCDPSEHLVATRAFNNYNTALWDNMTTSSIAISQCWSQAPSRLQPPDKFQQNITSLVLQYDDRASTFLCNCRFNKSLPSGVQLALDNIIYWGCFHNWKFIFVDYSYDSLSDSAVKSKSTCSKVTLQNRKFYDIGYVTLVEFYTDKISGSLLQCRKNFIAFLKWIITFMINHKNICYNISLEYQDASVDCITSPTQNYSFNFIHSVASATCQEPLQSCILLHSPKSVITYSDSSLLKKHVRILSSTIKARVLWDYCGLYFNNIRKCDHEIENCFLMKGYFWCFIFDNIFCSTITFQHLDCGMTYYQHHIVSKEYYIKINFNSYSHMETVTTIDMLECCITILCNRHDVASYFIPLIFHCRNPPHMWIFNELNCGNAMSYFDEMFNSKPMDNQYETLLGQNTHIEEIYFEMSKTRMHIVYSTANNLLQTWVKLQQCWICLFFYFLNIILLRQLSFYTSYFTEFFRVRSQCICSKGPHRVCVILAYSISEDVLIAEMHPISNIFNFYAILINYAFLKGTPVHSMINVLHQNYSKFKLFSKQSSILLCKHYFTDTIRNKSRWLMDNSSIPPLDRHYILFTPITYHQVTAISTNGSIDLLHVLVCKSFCLQEFSTLASNQDRKHTILKGSRGDNCRIEVTRDREGCNYWCLLLSFCSLSVGVMHFWEEDKDFGFQHSLYMKYMGRELLRRCRLPVKPQSASTANHHSSEESNDVERMIRIRVLEFTCETPPLSSNSSALPVNPAHYTVNVVSINKQTIP